MITLVCLLVHVETQKRDHSVPCFSPAHKKAQYIPITAISTILITMNSLMFLESALLFRSILFVGIRLFRETTEMYANGQSVF